MAMNIMAIELGVSLKCGCLFLFFPICATSRALGNFSRARQQKVTPGINSLWLRSGSSSKEPFGRSPEHVIVHHYSVILTQLNSVLSGHENQYHFPPFNPAQQVPGE